MLLSKGKIREELIDIFMTWRHSGLNVFCGPRIQPCEQESMENLTVILSAPASSVMGLNGLSGGATKNWAEP